MSSCLFCRNTNCKSSYLPSSFYNNKFFNYVQCTNCKLIYQDPLPNEDDYKVMYPPTYQMGIGDNILEKPYKKLSGLRFSYGHQFDLINKFQVNGTMLDYGCGDANFLINANHHNIDCDGVEYSTEHVEILKRGINGRRFFTIEDFWKQGELKYDIIRLSNVLEHLDNPIGIVTKLVSRLNPDGILLIEGPIETNFNLAQQLRSFYFRLKKRLWKNWHGTHAPTHIIFSNLQNQRDFFSQFNLKELHFEVSEAEWPFPRFQDVKGVGDFIKAFIAKLSMMLSKMNKNWGNTFLYIGRKIG